MIVNGRKSAAVGNTKRTGEMFYKHGLRNTPEYEVWRSMRRRCTDPKVPAYKSYGGRGIKVCPEWDNVETFVKDMGKRPDGHSLDRIDNDGDYCPENCRWVTQDIQANNRQGGIGRIYKNGNRWAVRFQGNTIYPRNFKSFETKIEAETYRKAYIAKHNGEES